MTAQREVVKSRSLHLPLFTEVPRETVRKLRTGFVSWSQEPARGGEMAQFSALRATEKRDPTRLDTFQTISTGRPVSENRPSRHLGEYAVAVRVSESTHQGTIKKPGWTFGCEVCRRECQPARMIMCHPYYPLP